MHTITLSDRLFATVTSFGTTVCNIAIDGATSMGDVVRRVHQAIGDSSLPAATLTVRNSSQGWSMSRMMERRYATAIEEATQLTLF